MDVGRASCQLAVLGVALCACSAQPGAAQETLRKGLVHKGTIDQTVSATGAIFPEERSTLSFEQSGYISDVLVEVGTPVKAGDVLARIDSTGFDLAVRQAELRVTAEELSYKILFDPPSKAQIAGAQAAVASAIANYNSIAAPPDDEQIRVAQLAYEQAYQEYLKNDTFGIAVANLESARLKLKQLTAPPDKNALAAASASIAQAQAQLDALRQGPDAATVARAQNQIDQAKLSLERARRQRDGATLTAPYDGIVSEVNINPGALAPATLPAVVVVDTSHLHVEVNVDEIDIAKIERGQPALVQFDALPDQTIQGQVTRVSPSSTSSAGVVTYAVRIDLAPTDLPIRSGMTATADIVIKRVADVLLVPNWAVRFERSTGQAFASVLGDDGKLKDTPVLLGIRSSTDSQVLAGLIEGQTVAVTVSPGTFTFSGGSSSDQRGGTQGQ